MFEKIKTQLVLERYIRHKFNNERLGNNGQWTNEHHWYFINICIKNLLNLQYTIKSDNISSNVETTHNNVEGGNVQLREANKYAVKQQNILQEK